MTKALLAALAAFAIFATGFTGTAEARCYRVGHHWSCDHHRLHYSHARYRARLAYGYGYAYPAYGAAYSAGSTASGPRASSGNGP
jgi:hypothetical protein